MKRGPCLFTYDGKRWHYQRCGWYPGGPAIANVVGVLFNPKALWVGAHYGEHHKRWCINILPCLTVWWTKPGGYLP